MPSQSPSIEPAHSHPEGAPLFSRFDERIEYLSAAAAGFPMPGEGVGDRRPVSDLPGGHLDLLAEELALARLPAGAPLPAWVGSGGPLTAVTRSESELSIVVPSVAVPSGVPTVGPWRALRVRGPLAFELTGVLAGLAAPLARAEVSIFAISTFDTDYLLVPSESVDEAVMALRGAGYRVSGAD